MKNWILGAALWLTLASGGFAQALSLDEAVKTALTSNATYLNAEVAVDQARAALSPFVNWKGISVSAKATQVSDSAVKTGESTQSQTYTVSLPLFDQLGASASVDQEGNKQVQVTATPLSHSDASTQNQIAYDRAVLTLAQTKTNVENAVRKAVLAQVQAAAQATVQAQKTALLEQTYQDAKVRYEKAQITLTEVRTALQDWTSARTTQTSLERSALKARSDLAALLAKDAEVAVDLDTLKALVAALGPLEATITGASTAVKLQSLNADSQRAKADAVWLLDPQLQVAAGASVPTQGQSTWNASVTLTLALGDFQAADKSLAERQAALAQQALETQRSVSRSAESQAVLAAQAAADTVEARELALVQARELQSETLLASKLGESTALEVEEAALGVTAAQNDVFAAWADLYGARLDLIAARS